MARRRIWRNKPEAEKERRRLLNKEKKLRRLEGEKVGNVRVTAKGSKYQFLGVDWANKESDRSETVIIVNDPDIAAAYERLSPSMKQITDGLLARGAKMEQVIRGLS